MEQLLRNYPNTRRVWIIVCLAIPVNNGYLPVEGIFTCFAPVCLILQNWGWFNFPAPCRGGSADCQHWAESSFSFV